MRWIHNPPPPEKVAALTAALGISPVLAELLLRAGMTEPGPAEAFIKPALARIADPFLLRNLARATARLRRALADREEIVVLGDYDVDGVSSTALLVSILRRFGARPRFVVPRRMEDGYGLSRSAIDRALEPGRPSLFIALDCGTNSHAEVDYLHSLGVDVIVVDHHRSKEKALEHGILINPHAHDEPGDEAWRHMCTVGLVFKLVHGLVKELRAEGNAEAQAVKLRDYLDLVALGTVADLVPLQEENRILASYGLRTLKDAARPGLRALMDVAGVRPGQDLMPVDISFRLGPRINASGRLADAALSVELILSDDVRFCRETAQQLDSFNRERQDIERGIIEEAERLIETQYLDQAGIVLYADGWHPGVVGIVAGRVTRKYHRPCIVLGNEGALAKGSGRSVDGINLVEVLGGCADLLESWGGHPMAVGVALAKSKLEIFRVRFAEGVRAWTGGRVVEPELPISAWLRPEQINEKLMDELALMHPFGQANPEPKFGLHGVVLRQRPEVFKGAHFRFALEIGDGRRRLFGVAWKMADRLPPVGEPIDLAIELAWNFFNDRKSIQLELVDWRRSTEA
ncbi:MAG: single-stranded-DNA-specific exonuclease RecJ [Opitutaceae bacterium]|nr:single-stranded-DNA-specific exonuclease RecJ [Opitutaceae bacterium]